MTVLGITTARPAGEDTCAWTLDRAGDLLRTASLEGLDEAVVLSTTGRTECYLVAHPDADVEAAWMAHVRQHLHGAERAYGCREAAAARHLFRVTCGADQASFDRDIPSSIKAALACAADAGTLGPLLDRSFQQAFAVRKAAHAPAGSGRGARRDSLDELVEQAVARWQRWRWAQPGETLLRRMLENEHACRSELVADILAAGFPGRQDQLDYLIRRAWRSALRAHARGLRAWLQQDAVMVRSAQ